MVTLSASPSTANRGEHVSLLADSAATPTLVEWDLDGNGSFETSTGANLSTTLLTDEPGNYTLSVRVHSSLGSTVAKTQLYVRGWRTVIVVPSAGLNSTPVSMSMIAAKPAIAFYEDGVVKYTRSSDPEGLVWGAPVNIPGSAPKGVDPVQVSLATVNGRPAIAVYSSGLNELRYSQAENAAGSAWSFLQSVAFTGKHPTLLVTNGVPVIVYQDGTNLRLVRANDANGSTWALPETITANSAGTSSSAKLIAGRVAITFHGNGVLQYIRATDDAASTWGSPNVAIGAAGKDPALIEVNGLPAIAFSLDATDAAYFIRGLNVAGSSWSNVAPLISESVEPVQPFGLRATIVRGKVQVTYSTYKRYGVGSLDDLGNMWGEPSAVGLFGGGPMDAMNVSERLAVCHGAHMLGVVFQTQY
jgi:hypothetical protein